MKPRTKLAKQAVEWAGKLPTLTDAQRKYAVSLFPKTGYYLKKGEVWCQCCGYIDRVSKPMLAVSLEMETHYCPNCGKSIQMEHRLDRQKKISERVRYSVVQSFRGIMVVRTFDVQRDNYYGFDTKVNIFEVFQNWITADGKEVITGKKYTRSPFHFSWDYNSKTDTKRHNSSASGSYAMEDVFDVTGNHIYPRASVTPLLKRNGWTGRLLKMARVSVVDTICQLLTNPLAETLVKTGQLSVFEYMLRKGNYEIPFRHALNICNRNHYIVQDASLWFDYLEALAYFNLDTHNAKYVCPPNLMEAHDKMMERKRKVKAKRSWEEKCKWEEVYKKDKGKFFEQMDYLTPELMRILKPGRLACIHVKDRVLFGNATGDGMPTIDPFSEMTVFHYMKHGFRYMGRITVDTDVVRENNQTYRLGYTEMCKDGSKMGIGCPEYVLLFRKLPSDTSRAYADLPVTKNKSEYSLARWQIDAHASWKSSGNSLLSYEDMKGAGIDKIRHLFRNYERGHVYDYEEHVSFAEELEAYGKLPKTFMAVDPVSKKPWIWDDVTRMRTLNTKQSQKKRQNHICPLQLDIVERLIERYSNKGELVFDPFGGIGTVPYCAINLGRKGLSTELNYDYWKDSLSYLYEAEMEVSAPTLFDLMNDAV